MNTKFTYALALTLSSAVLNLLLYFTGYQTEKLAVGQHLNWIGMIIMVAVLWLGIKAVREENGAKGLSFGQGLGAGVLISLYSGLMSAVYNFVHFTFINTDYADYQIELIRAKWAEAGISGAQMEQAEAMTRKFMSPAITSTFVVIMAVLFGLLISLIISAILKRPGTENAESPAA